MSANILYFPIKVLMMFILAINFLSHLLLNVPCLQSGCVVASSSENPAPCASIFEVKALTAWLTGNLEIMQYCKIENRIGCYVVWCGLLFLTVILPVSS